MDPTIVPVAQLYAMDTPLYAKALDGLDREALLRRPGGQANGLLWIAGHLAGARCGLARLLGATVRFPWPRLFVRGAEAPGDDDLPEVAEIRRAWDEGSSAFLARLAEVGEAELEAPSSRPYPIEDKSVRGAIVFLAYHEAYHIGQMSLLRKWLGQPGLVG